MYNTTVREPQLIINTPDPCDLYEATVVPLCQSAAPIAAVAAIKIPGGKIHGERGWRRGRSMHHSTKNMLNYILSC